MKIALFGATGGTGAEVLKQGVALGHTFRVLVRDPAALRATGSAVVAVQGDVLDPAAVAELITADCGAVISALGSPPRGNGTITLFSDGTRNALDAMAAAGVTRYAGISAGGLHSDACDPVLARLAKPILRRIFRAEYADLARMETIVAQSRATWTILVAPRLVNGPGTGTFKASRRHSVPNGFSIRRADLATAMLACLDDKDTYGELVYVAG